MSEDGKDGKEEARIQNKTKTPHVNVGKNNPVKHIENTKLLNSLLLIRGSLHDI